MSYAVPMHTVGVPELPYVVPIKLTFDADRSHRHQQDRINFLSRKLGCKCRCEFITDLALGIDAAHAREEFLGNFTDDAVAFDATQRFDRKRAVGSWRRSRR